MKKYCKILLTIMLFMSAALCMPAANAKTDVAIIGAMDCEIFYLENALLHKKTYQERSINISKGKIGKNTVVIAKSGMGKVNAATTAQFLIDKFKPKYIINIGVAGALSPKLSIGDVVIAKSLVQHDFDLSPIGFVKGAIDLSGDPHEPTYFRSDERLIKAINEQNTTSRKSLGIIASGDAYISSTKTKKEIREAFKADVVEMEGAAIAQTANLNNVPFVVLRIISDYADENKSDFHEFKNEMSLRNAELIEQLLLNQKLTNIGE